MNFLLVVLSHIRVASNHTKTGNELQALKGDRAGQHSITVNKQFRICFVWKNGNAENVEIVDYH